MGLHPVSMSTVTAIFPLDVVLAYCRNAVKISRVGTTPRDARGEPVLFVCDVLQIKV